MAWTAPRTWVTGETVTAALLNTHVRDNLLQAAAAKMTTQGDLIAASAANAPARLAVGSIGQIVTTDGTDPSWSSGITGAPLAITFTQKHLRLFESDAGDAADFISVGKDSDALRFDFFDDSAAANIPMGVVAPNDWVLHTGNTGQATGAVVIGTDTADAANLTTSGTIVLDVTGIITGGAAFVMGYWTIEVEVQTGATPAGTITILPRNDGTNIAAPDMSAGAHQLSRAGLVAGEQWFLSGSFFQRHTSTDTSDYELFVVAETNSEWQIEGGHMHVISIQYPT